MTVAGTFQNPQWSPALTNMTLVTNSYWQFDTTFLSNTNYSTVTNIQFKFAANGNWNANWGDNAQTQTNPPFGGTGISFGGNISASVTSNVVYRFTFNDATLVYTLQRLTVSPAGLTAQIILSNLACAFSFTNAPGAPFTVLASTNLSLPLSNWLVLGRPVESPPGNYQFTHLTASNSSRFFYRLRSP